MHNSLNPYQKSIRISRTSVALKTANWHMPLVLLLLCLSGNPAVCRQALIDVFLVSFTLLLAGVAIYRRQQIISKSLIVIACLFGSLLLLQCISFSFFPIVTICGFFTRLFIGYAVLRLVKNFPLVYVRAMFYLAILSLVFYISYQALRFVGYDLVNILTPLGNLIGTVGDRDLPILFHTFETKISYRNAGIFWEPGALAGYLNLALVFLWIVKGQIPAREYRRYLFILSAVLLTTVSTTGYLAYPLVLILHYDWRARERRVFIPRVLLGFYVLLPLLIAVSVYTYTKSDFLQTKIEHQFRQAIDQDSDGWHRTRIGTLLFDWEYIKRRPLTGWGLNQQTRFALHPQFIGEPQGMGNGMSDFTVKFGVSGMLVWLYCVFLGMIHLTKRNAGKSFLIMMILLLVLQGEVFLGFPLFLGLMFLKVGPGDRGRSLFGTAGQPQIQMSRQPSFRIAPKQVFCAQQMRQ